jgi:hypothetical protein
MENSSFRGGDDNNKQTAGGPNRVRFNSFREVKTRWAHGVVSWLPESSGTGGLPGFAPSGCPEGLAGIVIRYSGASAEAFHLSSRNRRVHYYFKDIQNGDGGQVLNHGGHGEDTAGGDENVEIYPQITDKGNYPGEIFECLPSATCRFNQNQQILYDTPNPTAYQPPLYKQHIITENHRWGRGERRGI